MRLVFSDHAKRRMKERKISKILVKEVVEASDHKFFDVLTKRTIFIKRLIFRERERYIAVAVDENEEKTVISVHPIRDRDFTSRTESGRWI